MREPYDSSKDAIVPRACVNNFCGGAGSKTSELHSKRVRWSFLQRQRLRFVARNVACRGGEIDLVMRDRDGALVFVEVRARAQRQFGGAAASIGVRKSGSGLVRAAQHYLMTRGAARAGVPLRCRCVRSGPARVVARCVSRRRSLMSVAEMRA